MKSRILHGFHGFIGLVLLLGIFCIDSHASADPLQNILNDVLHENRAGCVPVIVFNIDGVILDNRPRSMAILRDFVASGGETTACIADSVCALASDSIGYYIIDSFKRCGVGDLLLIEDAMKFWANGFFSDTYARKDVAVTGAVKFIRAMHDSGALIVYLSGRGRAAMLEGTIFALRNAGFPIGTSRSMLIMKPQPRDNNVAFKELSFNEISQLGTVVGAFENDPRMANRMKIRWPSANVVFVNMPHAATSGDTLGEGIAVINSF